jgi:hypothetical protein
MNTNPPTGSSPRSSSGLGSEPAAGLNEDLSRLRRDVASLKDNVGRLAAQAGGDVMKSVRNASQTVAAQVGDAAGGVAEAGSELASSARDQVKTFASELESMARRSPLGTIAGALVVGVIIGMMTRGRG